MNRKRRRIISVLLVLVVSFVFFLNGCSQNAPTGTKEPGGEKSSEQAAEKPQGKKPTIRFAHAFTGADVFGKVFEPKLDEYAEKNKDKAVFQFEPQQADDMRTKIKTDAAAGNLPDIFYYMTGGSVKSFVDANLLLDINSIFEKSDKLNRSMFSESEWAAYSFDGGKTIYGFPINNAVIFILANKSLFKQHNLEYPKTYEELINVAKVFKQNGIIPLAVGSKGGNTGHWMYAQVLYQFIEQEYTKNLATGKVKFTEPPFIKTAEIILDMAKNGVFPEDTITNSEYTPTIALYNARKAAMILTYSNFNGNYKDEIIAESECIDLPKLDGAVNDPSKFTMGNTNVGYCVNRASFEDDSKQQIMIDFLEFILSDDIFKEMVKAGRFVTKDVDYDPNDVMPIYVMADKHTKNMTFYVNLWTLMPDPTAQEVYSNTMDALWAQTVSAQEFCETVQKSIDKAVNK